MNALKRVITFFIFYFLVNQVTIAQSGGADLCSNSEPLCGSNVFSYPNSSGGSNAEAGPDYGCLGSQPNPAWFFLQIAQDGDLVLTIEQSTVLGGPPDLDVDFIIYGPFADTSIACSSGLTLANTVDCSYSPNNVENVNIINAAAGDYYLLLITNYSNQPGFITVNQSSGTGQTNCGILADEVGCTGETITLDATTTNATNYIWYEDDGFGNFVAITGVNTATYDVTSTNFYSAESFDAGNNLLQTYNFNVAFFETPVVNPSISDYELCDDDGIIQFDFNTKSSEVLNGLDPTTFEVTYYDSMADANSASSPLPLIYTNSLPSETIYVRVENILTDLIDCIDVGSFNINVYLDPIANPVSDFVSCSDTSTTLFDLSVKESEVLGSQSSTDFDVKFYLFQADADAGLLGTEINTPISNASSPQTVYVRIENVLNTDCYDTTSFDLFVNLNPIVIPVVDLFQCDDDNDGFTLFNLTEANDLISSNASNEIFTYYLTLAEAQGGLVADQISNYLNYPNPMPLSGVIYARIEAGNGCYKTAQINLTVSTTQIPGAFNLLYNFCDDYQIDNDNTNGIATFDFSDATTQILAQFPPGQTLTVSYYTNFTDALQESNAIADISNHRNDASPNVQNIVVRVDSDALNACLGLGEYITLTVDPVPLNNIISDYILCDGGVGQASFDLTTKDSEVIGVETQDILISYHETPNDAENNMNAIVSPYTNLTNPQTIYVRAQFDDNGNGVGDNGECVSTDMTFELIVNPNPVIFQPEAIQICNDQLNTVYDLTVREDQITGGDSSIVLTYFESQLDLDNNNPIVSPSMYNNNLFNRDIIVLATGSNTCTSTVTLSLETILYENLNSVPVTIEECEVDNDGYDNFDLTRRETDILNGLDPLNFTFDYYEIEADAIAGNSNSISNPTSFVNTQALTQIIYARVSPVTNQCFVIVPITLIVNPVPEIAIEDQYVICLSFQGQRIPPTLETFLTNPPIDTQLSSTEFSFQWYLGDPIPGNEIAGANDSFFDPTSAGLYSVLATNIITGCTIPATTEVIGSYPPQSITINISSEAFSDDDIIEVSVSGNGTYEYSLDHGLWQQSPRFENVSGGQHTVYVRDLYNCNEIFEIQTIIDYPRFFTPNGDAYNNSWNIYGIESQPLAKIYIYDRYGKLIKQLSPTGPGWDGTFNGNPLPSSDYWFTVEYEEPNNGSTRIFKSHFALKR
ncbi:T9SS type B sorting domain-containing protein [Yeosuana sp. MJ-SS3]|uniref:T9SS type B sorting domain-containing protein n=1 Tax=Gilvirhabdus luticola TaxID=3079858 RepID=A0ABU3U6L9_9FLAO|nr:T9SS type B sorting domain-containing protein [Yeosuana sp. MJ-SS3]MDU8885986.1 T9SS type B sorting domain-containing protein [Yeosuana sp. MJ-SS3]